jgi:parvulin-like peptidyl-prolyl isomerase
MNRQILVGMVAVALAGCTQTWPAAPPGTRTSNRLPPVGLTPVPNIYEAIAAENPRIDPASLHPENGPVLANLGTASGSDLTDGRSGRGAVSGGANAAAAAAAGPVAVPCQACQAQAADAPAPAPGPAPALAAAVAPAVPQVMVNRPAHLPGSSPGPAAATASFAQGTAPGSAAPAPVQAAEMPVAPPPDAPGPALPSDSGPGGSPISAAPAPAEAPAPTEDAVKRASIAAPQSAAGLSLEPMAVPAAPPGPPPETVPLPVPEGPPLPPASQGPSAAPAPAAMAPAPAAAGPPAGEGAPATVLPNELPPLPVLEAKDPPPRATTAPAPTASPPAAATEAPTPSPAAPAPAPGAAARSAVGGKVDPQVMTAAADPTAMHAEGSPVKLTEAGHIAARVGDEVITLNELTAAVKDRIAKLPGNYKPTHQDIKAITSQVLDVLIERSIIIQEAKRELKKPEPLKLINEAADKAWREEELPPLLRKYSVENEYKLKDKLTEVGKSLHQMRDTYRQEFLARGFLEQKLKHRITVTVPEMRDYYNDHLDDFNRPEQWTWREVLIEMDKHPNRAAARHKAEALLDRLRHGEDFAKLAQAESEGPNRGAGGLWETAPDSYAVEAVNSVVKSLPIGQVSPIIEGPSSYHVVRVEARRAAGPASFAEVQDKIRRTIHHRKADRESTAFLDKLRKQTVVTTIFDKTDYAPTATRPAPETAAESIADSSH